VKLLRLTSAGIAEMNGWLDAIHGQPPLAVPAEFFVAGRLAEQTGYGSEIEPREFSSRFEWAEYINQKLSGVPDSRLQADTGLWSWLTLVYFDLVAPPSSTQRKLGQRARYVPTGTDFRTYYRHLLAGPWQIFAAHRDDPDRTRATLAGKVDKPGELYEQLASRMELATSATVQATAKVLYLDSSTGRLKRGAGGQGPGSPRRLADTLMQFDRTFDIYAMPVSALVKLLPREFERFRRSAEAVSTQQADGGD
jgi:hypothetical protein